MGDTQTATVALPVLDGLVRQLLSLEGSESTCETDASRRRWQDCEAVRDLVRQAQICQALQTADSIDKSVLQDQRLLFQLKKQELLELLRKGQTEGEALRCARDGLASLALDAYPEAYSEFKRCMLAFVFGEGDEGAPNADLWKTEQRDRLADVLCNTLKLAVGARDSDLSYLLRYLLLTSQSFHAMRSTGQHTCEAACDLASKLLLPGRCAAPLPPDSGSAFSEAVVQALGQATSLSREDAIAALRRCHGNVDSALTAELGCFHLDNHLLEELAWEYALARDLLPAATPSDPNGTGSGDDSPGGGKQTMRHRSLSPRPRKMARWHPMNGVWRVEASTATDMATWGSRCNGKGPVQMPPEVATEKFAVALRVKALVAEARFDDAEAELLGLDAAFLQQHPKVLFNIRRCQFCTFVDQQKQQEALALARTQLTPLAQGNDDLLKEVRAAMSCILLGNSHMVSTESAVHKLQTSVCEALGLQEPRLMELVDTLLSVHSAYFQRQRCRDRFEEHIGIATLRHPSSADASTAPPPPPLPDPWEEGNEEGMQDSEDEDDEMEREGDDGEVSEANILLLMEFTGLPRVQCIELLLVHGNDPQTVLQTLFH